MTTVALLFIWVYTSNFRRGASDERCQQSAENSNTESAKTDCKKRDETEKILLSTDVAIHLGEDDHHRIEDDRHSICNKEYLINRVACDVAHGVQTRWSI